MKQLELNGHFDDLNNEDLLRLEGGESWVVTGAYVFGRILGEISKIHLYSGDTGQWMA